MTAQLDSAQPGRSQSHVPGFAENLAGAVVDGVSHVLHKPRARGWIHVYGAVVALIAGATLISVSWAAQSTRAGLATFAYTATIVAMFAVSGAYHRVPWRSEVARKWMKRLDHAMIFLFIAGSYTPFALLAMPHDTGVVVLSVVWGGALAGVALKMCWPSAPRWVGVPLYLMLGWVAVGFVATILHGAGVAALVLLVVGGAIYSIGAVLYALRWPNPWPTTFGHHEFFHACTAVAAVCHYIAIWFAVF
jgi:hemolysin III